MATYESILKFVAAHPERYPAWEAEAGKRKYSTIPTPEELNREWEAVTGTPSPENTMAVNYSEPIEDRVNGKGRRIYTPPYPEWAYRVIRDNHTGDRTEEEWEVYRTSQPTTLQGLATIVSDTLDIMDTALEHGNLPLAMAYRALLKYRADYLAEWEY